MGVGLHREHAIIKGRLAASALQCRNAAAAVIQERQIHPSIHPS